MFRSPRLSSVYTMQPVVLTRPPVCFEHSVVMATTFTAAGPRLWNSIPVQLRNPDITYGLFQRQLFGKHEHGAL